MKEHKFTNDTEVFPFKVNATELTYIYHLISKWKVKGISSSTFVFAEILQRIGTVSKLFNYYDKFAKYLSEYIQSWITSFEDGVTLEGQNTVEDTQVEEVK